MVPGMSAHNLERREFIKLGLAASTLPLTPRFSFAGLDEDRTTWYRNAKFGMFIHWGPYSLASVEASWPIMEPKPEKYRRPTTGLYPSALIRSSSTLKHLSTWLDQPASNIWFLPPSITMASACSIRPIPTTRSPTLPTLRTSWHVIEVVQKREMRLGFYYSPPDMHHPGFRDTSKLSKDNWNGQPERPEWPLYLDYMQLQLTELLTDTDPVALIWFDGLHHQEKYGGVRFINLIHELQSATLVNDRIGVPGDYQTPEQFIPRGIPTKGVHFNAVDTSIQEKLQ